MRQSQEEGGYDNDGGPANADTQSAREEIASPLAALATLAHQEPEAPDLAVHPPPKKQLRPTAQRGDLGEVKSAWGDVSGSPAAVTKPSVRPVAVPKATGGREVQLVANATAPRGVTGGRNVPRPGKAESLPPMEHSPQRQSLRLGSEMSGSNRARPLPSVQPKAGKDAVLTPTNAEPLPPPERSPQRQPPKLDEGVPGPNKDRALPPVQPNVRKAASVSSTKAGSLPPPGQPLHQTPKPGKEEPMPNKAQLLPPPEPSQRAPPKLDQEAPLQINARPMPQSEQSLRNLPKSSKEVPMPSNAGALPLLRQTRALPPLKRASAAPEEAQAKPPLSV